MKIDNSGDQDVHMDTSILCGRTRHEAATMEQTIRDIMRTTTSEGISDREDDIFMIYSDLMVMNEDTLNNMIRCSVCLEIYNDTSRQRACITECCHQVFLLTAKTVIFQQSIAIVYVINSGLH